MWMEGKAFLADDKTLIVNEFKKLFIDFR